jgi:uncharacterized protein (UPF0276 family)
VIQAVVAEAATAEAVVVVAVTDTFGIGWRPELAADILTNLARLDVVEVIVEAYLDAGSHGARALRTLSASVPVVLHGISLGLASTVPVEEPRLRAVADFVAAVQPRFWSEHLAYVRGAQTEVGHLLAPSRSALTAAAAARNIRRAADVVGAVPLIENVATLLDPPGSDMEEPVWIGEVVSQAKCGVLLDLHNVYTNCINVGGDPFQFVADLPAESIRASHLAGGQSIEEPRLGAAPPRHRVLDDHRHPVPDVVYELLTAVGTRVPHSLTVLLEYDGCYPPIEELLSQLDRARAALAAGPRLWLRSPEGQHELP